MPIRFKKDILIGLAISIFAFLILVFTLKDYGITGDEPENFHIRKNYLLFVFTSIAFSLF